MKHVTITILIVLVGFILGSNTWNGAEVISGGAIIDPPVWDDIRVPLSRAKAVGAGSDADFEVFIDDTMAYTFETGSDEELFISAQLPHDYKLGSSLDAHIHISPSNTDTGNVVFCLEYTFQMIGGTFASTTTICSSTCAGSGTAFTHTYCDIGNISGAAITGVSAMLVARIYRDVSEDTYNADMFGLEVDFHYQKDTLGSRQETSKW